MTLPKWLQELKDAHEGRARDDDWSNYHDLLNANGSKLIRIAEAAARVIEDLDPDALCSSQQFENESELSAALRGDEKPTS